MATIGTPTGKDGALIYLAESLAGLKAQVEQSNHLLRELVELAREGRGSGDQVEVPEDDFVKFMQAQEEKARAHQSNGSGK
jgi:hypothetical protein